MNAAYIDYLQHHGILGMKWGNKNGPPYPLGASDHSVLEKKAGWKKSLNNKSESNDSERKGLSDKQKRWLKRGAIVAGVALATVGVVYLAKSGKLDNLIQNGKNVIDTSPELHSSVLSQVNGKGPSDIEDQAVRKNLESTVRNSPFASFINIEGEKYAGIFERFEKPESFADTLSKTNPFDAENEVGDDNCGSCGMAALFRRYFGIKAEAKGGFAGKGINLLAMAEKCFEHGTYKAIEGNAVKFGLSADDAAEFLVKRFGQNAAGCCGINWTELDEEKKARLSKGIESPMGHIFNWEIIDGKVSFFDAQSGYDDVCIRQNYWSRRKLHHIDSNSVFSCFGINETTRIRDPKSLEEFLSIFKKT